ncbi:MAG: glycosyl hydrolase family 65 protein, partial [Kordia sp.]
KVNYRNHILKINVTQNGTSFELEKGDDLVILVDGKKVAVSPNDLVTV